MRERLIAPPVILIALNVLDMATPEGDISGKLFAKHSQKRLKALEKAAVQYTIFPF